MAVKISYNSYLPHSPAIAPMTSTCETETSKNTRTHIHTEKKKKKDREKLHTSLTRTKCLSHNTFFLLLNANGSHTFWSSLVLDTHTHTYRNRHAPNQRFPSQSQSTFVCVFHLHPFLTSVENSVGRFMPLAHDAVATTAPSDAATRQRRPKAC